MKFFSKLLFGLFIFFTIFLDVSNAKEIKFSCDYSYEDIKFRIKANIDESYVKSLRQEAKNNSKSEIGGNISVFVLNNGNYEQVDVNNKGTKNYDGYKQIKKKIYFFQKNNIKESYKQYLENAFISTSYASCPNMYLDQTLDEMGNKVNSDYMFVPSSKWTTSTSYGTTNEGNNIQINLEGSNCYDENDNIKSNCNLEENTNVRNDDSKLECDYSANGSNTFRIIYYKEDKKASFHPIGNGIMLNKEFKLGETDSSGNEYIDSSSLINAFSSGSCPLEIECDCSSAHGCDIYDSTPDKACGKLLNNNGKTTDYFSEYMNEFNVDIDPTPMACSEILGTNLTKIVKLCITIARIAGAVITLIMAMTALIPPIVSGDSGALNTAFKKCITLAIILAIICLLPTFIKLIGDIGGFDLSCFS